MRDKDSKCCIVAEIGINHSGSLPVALKMIDAAKTAGCDFVKFQKRTIDVVYTKEDLDRPRVSSWGTTNREQKLGLEFEKEEYDIIDVHCKNRGINWFASPWDVQSVNFLTQYDCPFIKIASASTTDFDLLQAVRNTKKSVILSTGMSTEEEVKKAVDFLGDQVKYILACTSTYPTKIKEMNLKFIQTLQKEYPDIEVGFSNHHPGILFAATSVVFGAKMVEFHITLDRAMYGSDQAASIEVPGVLKLVRYIRDLEVAIGSGSWIVFNSEEEIKKKLRR